MANESDIDPVEPDGVEIIVREPGPTASRPPRRSRAHSAGETAVALGLSAAQLGFAGSRAIYRRAADTAPGRLLSEVAAGAMDALADDVNRDVQRAIQAIEERLGQAVAVVAPVIVQSIDTDELMKHLDINTILDNIDVNALLSRVDIDALLEKVDVAALAKQARIGELVTESTSEVAVTALDVGRRQAVALDTLLARAVGRLLGRDPDAMPQGPAVLVDPPS